MRDRGFDDPLLVHRTFGLAYQTGGKYVQGRIVIPITDLENRILAYAARWAGDDDDIPEGEGKYKLPKTEQFRRNLALFNAFRAQTAKHVAIVEGYFDAIWWDLLGIDTVAAMGNSISEQQIELLKSFPNLQAVTVALDGGEHSAKLTDRMCGQIARSAPKFRVRALDLPKGKQPDTVGLLWMSQHFPSLTRQTIEQRQANLALSD